MVEFKWISRKRVLTNTDNQPPFILNDIKNLFVPEPMLWWYTLSNEKGFFHSHIVACATGDIVWIVYFDVFLLCTKFKRKWSRILIKWTPKYMCFFSKRKKRLIKR